MIITSTRFDEDKSLFIVQIDDDEFFVSYEMYEELELKNEKELSFNEFNRILTESMFQKAKKITERFINYKPRTEFEVYQRLKKDIDNENAIYKTIDYYKKLMLLDDKKYIQDYIEYSLNVKNNSKSYTKHKLINKGLKSNDIDIILEEYDDEVEYENIKLIFDKKYSDINLDDIKNINKIYRYLSGKGFNYQFIKDIINERKE